MFINSYFRFSTLITPLQEKTFSSSLSTSDLNIKLIGTLLLGGAALSASAYLIYRFCFQTKEIKEDLDASAEKSQLIGQQELVDSKEVVPAAKAEMEPLTKARVIKKAEDFHHKLSKPTFPKVGCEMNTTAIDQVKALYQEETILNALQNTQVLVHPAVSELAEGFLQYKLKFGSKIEKSLYASMSKEDFIARLMTQRPLMFMCSNDYYKLKNGEIGEGGFESIGTDNENHLFLKDYLSYDEMEIAAMIGVSVPTRFINKGNTNNLGKISQADDYEEQGVCIGLVGARLEREGYMEYQRLMVTPTQNTKENGYGPLPINENDDDAVTAKMRLFAKFYNIDYFPTYEEISTSDNGYSKCDKGFISEELFKRRMKINIENYLHDANARAGESGQKAYAQPYGWGLSAWIKADIQRRWFIEAFLDVINKGSYPHIADVDFSFVMKYQAYAPGLDQYCCDNGMELNQVKLHFPNTTKCRELCAKLTGDDEGKLLVNSYGWDGNSYCGNEYWDGALTASGDPIMMCASPLQVFAQVPEINPYLTQNLKFIAK